MSRDTWTIGILLYGASGQPRDAGAEEKYRLLVERMAVEGLAPRTLCYHATRREAVRVEALACNAVLVWINPTEPELDRTALDEFLRELSKQGVLVSAHPDTILKLGTKEVLVESQPVGWTVEAFSYRTEAEFRAQFPGRVRSSGPRVLKQHRGNGGHGVWKVSAGARGDFVAESAAGGAPESMDEASLLAYFVRRVFDHGSHLVDQAWVPSMTRGMVRAYLCGRRVAGFGFQEIVALHRVAPGDDFTRQQPTRRHYYSEQCALFQPLRQRLEGTWIPALAARLGLDDAAFPLLWDADFFFADPPQDYVLCEINVSCVSPFPESAITPLIREMKQRLAAR